VTILFNRAGELGVIAPGTRADLMGGVVLGVACSVMHPLTEIVVALTDHRTAIRSIQERSTYPNAGYRSGGADFGSNAPHKWGILRIALRA